MMRMGTAKTLIAAIVFAILFILPYASHAATWKVDYSASKLSIIALVNGTKAEGQLESFRATIKFNPEHPESAHISVDIDLSAVKMKDPQQTAALRGVDWFNIAQFPTATFTSTNVHATGNNTFAMAANLTLKGKTVAIALPFTFVAKDNKAHAHSEFVIMRNDFAVGAGQFSSGAIVGLEVKLLVDISAEAVN